MKPRSRIEQQFVDWAGQLPPLGEKHRAWAREQFPAEALYYSRRGNHSEFHCMCCGAVVPTFGKWPVDEKDIPRWMCPECGAECKVLPRNGKGRRWFPSATNAIYATLADVFNDIQVFRTFEVFRYNYRTTREDGTPCGSPTEYQYHEVWQNWIRPDGKETITNRPYARSFNFFNWNHQAGYVIGRHNSHYGGYYAFGDVFDVTGNYFFPGQRFTPLLRRNGMRERFLKISGLDPVVMCRRLLKDNRYEEVVKLGYVKLAVYLTAHDDRRMSFLHAVRICARNGYRINDPGLWLDYFDDLVFLGLDTHNAHYVCPKSLKKAHAQTTRRREHVLELQWEEERRKEAAKWEERYAKAKAPFLGIVFGDGHITLSVIQSVEDVRQEGAAMHHCVFSHGYYKKPDRILMSARDESGKRLETVEIGLDPYKVLQSRGLQNGTTKAHKAIVALCEANMDAFRRAVPKMTVPLHLVGENSNYYQDRDYNN